MGYRWYEANNVKPVFPLGMGFLTRPLNMIT